MRIGIVGSGALGLYYGAKLQQGGQDVHFLLRRDYDAIGRDGLHVHSVRGDFHLPQVQGYRSSSAIGAVDLVLIGLKAHPDTPLDALIGPLVGPQTVLLTLQNGLGNEEQLAALWGPGRVIGGVAFLCSNRGDPGTVHHLDYGAIQLAELAHVGLSTRVAALAELFARCDVPCEAKPDLAAVRWRKLVWNIPFNGLCALMGKTTGELLAHGPTRQLALDIMREVVAASASQALSDPLEPGLPEQLLHYTESMRDYRPSMLIDRAEGRPLELDAIYREPQRRAAARNVSMARTGMLCALLDLQEPQRQAPAARQDDRQDTLHVTP